uniref:Glycosyl transferase family 1 domain-containing protein n=1 Tax=Panagrolaimus sp. JU765 TaxID=591449 RepID=A0AC34QP09_9BILA
MVAKHKVEELIEFIPSPTEDEKFRLYRECDSALYTPPNEHFGIVPIEALEQRRPVIVIDSGGPAETVAEGVTGTKIKAPEGPLLAEAMIHHMQKDVWEELDYDEGYVNQRKRFEREYSLDGFGARIDEALTSMFPGMSTMSSTGQSQPSLSGNPTEIHLRKAKRSVIEPVRERG